MFKQVKDLMQRKRLFVCGVLLLTLCGQGKVIGKESRFVAAGSKQQGGIESWREFHSAPGNCVVSLPHNPEHVRQVMPLPNQGVDLRYDVYVAAFEKKAVYMMLIAQYPPFLDETYAELGLESFLNGLITQNPNNRLVFADLTTVQGHKAIDFFIQTKEVFFKGRAIMAGSVLYLLAMECEGKNYLDNHFNHFITSFQMKK